MVTYQDGTVGIRSRIHWGRIFAGVLAGVVTNVALLVLGGLVTARAASFLTSAQGRFGGEVEPVTGMAKDASRAQ